MQEKEFFSVFPFPFRLMALACDSQQQCISFDYLECHCNKPNNILILWDALDNHRFLLLLDIYRKLPCNIGERVSRVNSIIPCRWDCFPSQFCCHFVFTLPQLPVIMWSRKVTSIRYERSSERHHNLQIVFVEL